jgi:carbonic anhydrase
MKKIILTISLITFFCSPLNFSQQKESTLKINNSSDALAELKAGNNRFLNNLLLNTNYFEQIESSKEKQTPHSVILSCMDSRVPPEIIFDQGIGNIFVLRNAGNIEDENILGSIEYAVKFAGAKLLVVMGHTKCGAVSGAIKNVDAGNLTQLLNQIKPAIPEAADKNDLVNITAKNNVLMTIKDILKRSKIINELVNSGDISIVGAIYEVETGRVLFIE